MDETAGQINPPPVGPLKGIRSIEFNAVTAPVDDAQGIVTKQHLWRGWQLHGFC